MTAEAPQRLILLFIIAGWKVQWFKYLAAEPETGNAIPTLRLQGEEPAWVILGKDALSHSAPRRREYHF